MTSEPIPPGGGLLPNMLNDRLNRLRDRLRALVPDRPDGLEGLRLDLEALRAEADGLGRQILARALERLALMTEVWDCLAAECPESACEAASFCSRALDLLADAEGDERDADNASWILQESSASWSDYLGLIDSWGTDGLAGREETPPDLSFAEPPPPEIDAETLVRMLTGGTHTPRAPEPVPPPPRALARDGPGEEVASHDLARGPGNRPGKPSPPDPPTPVSPSETGEKRLRPAPAVVLEIDPDCREAFLSEAVDLFERIESLVLSLGRGPGHMPTLTELRRCFHTLKGAAGSVGLIELASRVHFLEEQLEQSDGLITPGLLDQLHQSLNHLEGVLEALRRGSSPRHDPGEETVAIADVDPCESPADRPRTVSTFTPAIEANRPAGDDPPPSTEPTEGPVRVSSGKIDELMDLASELIMRRGLWAAQSEKLKAFAALIRAGRNELLIRLDHLDELGITRAARASRGGGGGQAIASGPARSGAGVDPSSDLLTVVLRLVEQAEDLVVLTEAAQAEALPLTDDSDSLARLTLQLWETLQSIRIVPVRGLFQRLARVAHDAARVEGLEVEVVMIGEETGLDRAVQDKAFEPLLHVVRNAVGHGIEAPDGRIGAGKPASGRVTLEASREGNTLVLSVQDDGRGLDYEAIAEKGRRLGLLGTDEVLSPTRLGALIFLSGFSTRQEANAISGRGVGMDVVAQEVRRLRGTIDLTSQPGRGTRITLRLPARLALEQAMITRVAGQAFAIPVNLVEHAQAFEPGDVDGTAINATVRVRDRRVPLIVAREVLGFSRSAPASCPKLLLVRADGEALALLFDAIEGIRELVIKPLGPLLAGHPVIWGTSLSLTGDVIFVLDPSGLFRWLREGRAVAAAPEDTPAPRLAPVLVVDDSISVRRVVSRQLRGLGLEVEEVSDGVEALGKLSSRSYSMVLTDLEMPRMDGFELLAELRRSPTLAALPVIVASTEGRPATRRKALALGARAFVAKPIDPDELARVAGTLLDRAIGRQ